MIASSFSSRGQHQKISHTELYTTQNKQHKFFTLLVFFLHTETEKKGQNIGKFKVFFFVNLLHVL